MAPAGPLDQLRAFQRSDPANKLCADCTEIGPTYVCVSFHTFVCQSCSGLHREFGHRVKSISLSQWDVKELESIKSAGGNMQAAKRWATLPGALAQKQTPSAEDLAGAREFLKLKYIQKKWVGPIEAGDKADASTEDGSQDGSQSEASLRGDGSTLPEASAKVPLEPASKEIMVQVPGGVVSGQQFLAEFEGQQFYVTVPANAEPGTMVRLQVALPPPATAHMTKIGETHVVETLTENAPMALAPWAAPQTATPSTAAPPSVNLLDDVEPAIMPATSALTEDAILGAAGEAWIADFMAAGEQARSDVGCIPGPVPGSDAVPEGRDLLDVDSQACLLPRLAKTAPANLDLLSFGEASVSAVAVTDLAPDLFLQGMAAGPVAELTTSGVTAQALAGAPDPALALSTAQPPDPALQGMDLFGAIQISEPGPAIMAAQGLHSDGPSNGAGSPRAAFQEKVSSCRNDDIMRLFKHCEKAAPPANSLNQPADSRFAAFDNMESHFAMPPSIGGLLNACAMTNAPAHIASLSSPLDAADTPLQVKSQVTQTRDIMSLFAQVPPVTPAVSATSLSDTHSGWSSLGGCTAEPQQVAMPFTANQLLQCKPHELEQMQDLISHVMNAHNQASVPVASAMPAMQSASALHCAPPSDFTQELRIEKEREFDDLVLLFKEKVVST